MRVYVFPLLGGYQNSAINLEQHALHPPRPIPSGFDGTQRPSEEEGGPWGSMPTRSAYAYTIDGNSSMSSSLRNHSSSAELDPLQCTWAQRQSNMVSIKQGLQLATAEGAEG